MNLKFLVFNIEDSSVMTFTVKDMKNLLQLDLVTELEKLNINIIAKIKQLFYKLFVETCSWKVMAVPDGCSGKANARLKGV